MSNIKILGTANQMFRLGSSGLEQLYRVHLSKGTIVFAYGFAMSKQTFVVYDDDMNAVELFLGDDINAIDKYDLDKYFSEIHHLDETTLPISKKFGIGFYYDESGELVPDEIIERSLKRAEAVNKFRQQEKERKERESLEETERLKKEYDYLTRCEKNDHVTTGKNIRAELKRNFPKTKFSVRYKSFSGGDEYFISWTDGPTTKEVDNIVRKYGDMHPDPYSMGDYWDCVPSNFNYLFGSVGYVSVDRSISSDGIEYVKQKYSDLTEENMKNYPYGIDGANSFAYGCDNLNEMLRWLARSMRIDLK